METTPVIWGKHGFMTCSSCGHIVIKYDRAKANNRSLTCCFCHKQLVTANTMQNMQEKRI